MEDPKSRTAEHAPKTLRLQLFNLTHTPVTHEMKESAEPVLLFYPLGASLGQETAAGIVPGFICKCTCMQARSPSLQKLPLFFRCCSFWCQADPCEQTPTRLYSPHMSEVLATLPLVP